MTTSITGAAGRAEAISPAGRCEEAWSRASRRQAKSCDGRMPIRWAIADTLAPGSSASATTCALNSSDQRRRSCRGAPSRRSATASIMWKVLVPELGADIEAHIGSQRALSISDRQPPTPDGVSLPLTKNFAGQLAFIDALAGTLYLPARMPRIYGTDDPVPPLYHQQLAYPLKEIVRRTPASGLSQETGDA